ncbi:MAG: hypothetical protein E6K70_15135 [Planctomycetota bacterium]|nr:MAG: hypothetical protein E6K70_15135 [Planctomycetota bacterium]
MDGAILKQRPAPQVIRCFAPSRLADDLLAEVYERLLKTGTHGFGVPTGCMEPAAQEHFLDQEQSVATGGRR